jgi:hypothetical protein
MIEDMLRLCDLPRMANEPDDLHNLLLLWQAFQNLGSQRMGHRGSRTIVPTGNRSARLPFKTNAIYEES